MGQGVAIDGDAAHDQPADSADEAHKYGLQQELYGDLPAPGPQRAAQSDLTAAFPHAHHHGVGDSDAANEKGDPGEGENQPGERAQGRVPSDLKPALQRALDANARTERLINALPTPARGESQTLTPHPVDLADVAGEAMEDPAEEARTADVHVTTHLAPRTCTGRG